MITLDKVERIAAALATGLSARQTAKLTGVGRGVVQAIANGRRGLWGRENQTPTPEVAPTATRCRSCGSLIYPPCIRCQAVAYLEAKGGAA